MAIAMTSNYSEQTKGARDCLVQAIPWVKRACATINATEWCFADFGAADGGTSVELYRTVADAAEDRRVTFVLNDLPGADWATLAQSGQRASEGRDDVVYLCPRSFYERVAPPGSVHMGFSATAMHWLSTKRTHLLNHTHANAAPPSAERAQITQQAEDDWARLVALRHDELAPGGHLIVVNLAQDERGFYLGHNGRDRNMHDELHDIWRSFRVAGQIDDATYRRATFQNYYKTAEQFLAPVMGGWQVHGAQIRTVACPYRAKFDRDEDAEGFARALMRTVRSWSEHTFADAFSDGDDHGLVARLYDEFQRRVAAEPTQYSMDYVQHYLWVQKEA